MCLSIRYDTSLDVLMYVGGDDDDDDDSGSDLILQEIRGLLYTTKGHNYYWAVIRELVP